MAAWLPTVLLCTSAAGQEVRAFEQAAGRAGVSLHLVSDRDDHLLRWPGRSTPARFDRESACVQAALAALDGVAFEGVIVLGDRPAWLAAHLAASRGLPGHHPDAVAVATDPLLARGRWLAAGLPVPWFVSLPAEGDDDLDRLTRVHFPSVLTPVGLPEGRGRIRVDSFEELMTARRRLAALLARAAAVSSSDPVDGTLIVEGLVAGRAFALTGVLEAGALRVFALFEKPDVLGPGLDDSVLVTPARLPPARQHVIAGHIARAALALGLHHGPLHAHCRVDGDDIVVGEVSPRAIGGACARAIPIIGPDGTRCGLEDVWLAHARGQSLDGYGHQAIARGVLMVPVPLAGRLREVSGVAATHSLPGVTGVELPVPPGTDLEPMPEGLSRPAVVFAEGEQPDDVIATLREASRQLEVVMDGPGDSNRPTPRA